MSSSRGAAAGLQEGQEAAGIAMGALEKAGAEDNMGRETATTTLTKRSSASQNTTSAREKARKEMGGNTIPPSPGTMEGLLAQEGINNVVIVAASAPLKTSLISHHLL